MKYQHKITINKPLNEVIEKFSDPDNLEHWQRGFIFMKPINGELGAEGSQNLLKYEIGKRQIEMTETILKNNLPYEFSATYKARRVYNSQKNSFKQIDQKTSVWIADNEFEFSGFMKLFGWFMPGAFKKQSWTYMKDFKAFVQKGKSIKNE